MVNDFVRMLNCVSYHLRLSLHHSLHSSRNEETDFTEGKVGVK